MLAQILPYPHHHLQGNFCSLLKFSRISCKFCFCFHKNMYPTVFSLRILQLPGLNAYKGYCSNQLAAKALLDQKKQDPRVQDFLQRCLESPFSRKLDLWSFLDIPRSRLVKYPLLLKEILRHTPKDHPDVQPLEEAVSLVNDSQIFQVYILACLRNIHSGTLKSYAYCNIAKCSVHYPVHLCTKQ